MPLKTLICGAYTYGNQGDDAIKSVLVDMLRDAGVQDIVIARPYPDETLVQWADVVIIGGGGLLYDDSSAHFDYYFKQYGKWAMQHKKKLLFCGVGYQGIKQKESINLLNGLFDYAALVSVRQQADADALHSLGLLQNILVADDLAFVAEASSNYTLSLPCKPALCIIPSVADGSFDAYQWMAETAISLGYDLHIAVTSYEDIPVAEKLNEAIYEHDSIRVFKYLSFGEVIHLLHQMDVVITARYHGIVFANNQAYQNHPKVFIHSGKHKLVNQLSASANISDVVEDRNTEAFEAKLRDEKPLLVRKHNHSDLTEQLRRILLN